MSTIAGQPEPVQQAGRIRLMLSGGGHRAMIGGIGAILYLVQANWWPRVDEVISVSGGSVTNAALMGSTSEDDQEQINNLRRLYDVCLLYTSPSPRDATLSRMPSSA